MILVVCQVFLGVLVYTAAGPMSTDHCAQALLVYEQTILSQCVRIMAAVR